MLEKNPNGNIDVVTCANEVLSLLNNVQYNKIFVCKLLQCGVNIKNYSSNNKYTCIYKREYIIDNDFPCLKKTNIPNVVFDVKYKINLNTLDKYLKKE